MLIKKKERYHSHKVGTMIRLYIFALLCVPCLTSSTFWDSTSTWTGPWSWGPPGADRCIGPYFNPAMLSEGVRKEFYPLTLVAISVCVAMPLSSATNPGAVSLAVDLTAGVGYLIQFLYAKNLPTGFLPLMVHRSLLPA